MQTLWTFRTRNFRVTLECDYDNDSHDRSWADEETLSNLNDGTWASYLFKVAVYDASGAEIGADYLGDSIYADPLEFIDHRECGRANREHAAAGRAGRCGSYFTDMVHEAIRQARLTYNAPRVQLRNVA